MSIVTEHNWHEELDKLKEVLVKNPTLVVDVETNGLDSYGMNQICGVGVGEPTPGGLVQYYPFRHHQGNNLSGDSLIYLMHLKFQILLSNFLKKQVHQLKPHL